MDQNLTTLERAFQLAGSGEHKNITSLRSQLKSEGYSLEQLSGKQLLKQLRTLMVGSQAAAPEQVTTSKPGPGAQPQVPET